jgi:hypothetical protein
MAKPRKSRDEKDLEKLAKKLLSTPHKPREDLKVGKERTAKQPSKRQRKIAK